MITNNEEIPVDMWTQLRAYRLSIFFKRKKIFKKFEKFRIQPIIKRLSKPDCTRRGWVLEGFPKTRSQAKGQIHT